MMIIKGCLGAPHSGLTVLCKSPHRPATNRCYIDDDYDEDYDDDYDDVDKYPNHQQPSTPNTPEILDTLASIAAQVSIKQSTLLPSQPSWETAYPPPPTFSYFFF